MKEHQVEKKVPNGGRSRLGKWLIGVLLALLVVLLAVSPWWWHR
jgi:hypothetical protein